MRLRSTAFGSILALAVLGSIAGFALVIYSFGDIALLDSVTSSASQHGSVADAEHHTSAVDEVNLLLARTGLSAKQKETVGHALLAQHEPSGFRQDDRLSLEYRADGTLSHVTLEIDESSQIEISLDGSVEKRSSSANGTLINQSSQLLLKGSIQESVERAGVPIQFAIDLAFILGGVVDYRDDLNWNNNLTVLWRQSADSDEHPQLDYAAIEMGRDLVEIVWSKEDNGRATTYLNGNVLQRIPLPADGIRLAAVFGQSKHQINGTRKMHAAVDYVAPIGSPVSATAPGLVTFVGFRNGYGRVVEIAHGSEIITRYAHLSAQTEGLEAGKRVLAGEVIGLVGESGTIMGPSLHYEVRVN